MKHRINHKVSFVISISLGFLAVAGASSARPIEGGISSRGCIHAQQILDDFRMGSGTAKHADLFEMESPLEGQPFQVRWLDIDLPDGVEKIDPEEDDPDTFKKMSQKNNTSTHTRVTMALAQRILKTDKIDPEEDDPDTTPKSLPTSGSSLASIDMVLFERSANDPSDRDLQGCVIWHSTAVDKIDPEEDDPDTKPKAGNSPRGLWFRFSLPAHIAPEALDGGRRGREDMLWWLLGLGELKMIVR